MIILSFFKFGVRCYIGTHTHSVTCIVTFSITCTCTGNMICLDLSRYMICQQWLTGGMPNGAIHSKQWHGPTCHGIHKIAGAHAPGMPGTFSPSPQVSDPDMHHGTCVTHVPWCMPGSLTSSFLWSWRWGENVPGIPGACATRNFTYLVRGPWYNTSNISQLMM